MDNETYGRTAREALRDMVGANEGPDVVAELRYTIRAAEDLLRVAVRDLRAGGVSWADLGTMLGTTRQAAWEKYRDALDD